MAELSWAGTSQGATTSRARTRPRAARTLTLSQPGGVERVSRMTWRAASTLRLAWGALEGLMGAGGLVAMAEMPAVLSRLLAGISTTKRPSAVPREGAWRKGFGAALASIDNPFRGGILEFSQVRSSQKTTRTEEARKPG